MVSSLHSLFFFSSRRRHTRLQGDWSSDVCSSDLFAVKFFGQDSMVLQRLAEEAERRLNTIGGIEDINTGLRRGRQIGRASCRERVEISVGEGAVKKNRRIGEEERRARGEAGEANR